MRFCKTAFCAVIVFLIAAPNLWSDTGPGHKRRQGRPIRLGTSGGNVNDRTSQFCCSGTLGALLMDQNGRQYVLSNNHVLGMANKAKVGHLVSQPGNIDVGCLPKDTDIIATLTRFIKMKFGANSTNRVDAAIAEVMPGKVRPNGFILDVKIPGQPVEAEVGMGVKKSGRTTGTRKGEVDSLNVTIAVRVPNSCGSSGSKIARFVDQIYITDAPGGTPPPFIAGGDSGSLLVRNVAQCPATLGLLFAGNSIGDAVANRIQNVLTAFGGMKIVGCAAPVFDSFDPEALTPQHPQVIHRAAIQSRHEKALMSIPGVIGVGIGFAKPGVSRELGLVVYVARGTRAAESSSIPSRIEGVPVRVRVTEEFVAF